jgi:hypothetical protein
MNIRPLASTLAIMTGSITIAVGSPVDAGQSGCIMTPSTIEATYNLFDGSMTPPTANVSGDASGLPNFANSYYRVLADGVEVFIYYQPPSTNPWNINTVELDLLNDGLLGAIAFTNGTIDPTTIDELVFETGFNPDGTTLNPYCSTVITFTIINEEPNDEEPNSGNPPRINYQLPVVASKDLPNTL